MTFQTAVQTLQQRSTPSPDGTRGSGQDADAVSHKRAAVLVPLFEGVSGEVRVLLTQRSHRLKSHPGEVSFPGGKRDPEDVDDVATALRETEEELGISREDINVIKTCPPLLSKHLYSVTPVVATIPPETVCVPNKDEVAAVFSCPLSLFLDTEHSHSYIDASWDGIRYRLHSWVYNPWNDDGYRRAVDRVANAQPQRPRLRSDDASNSTVQRMQIHSSFTVWGLTAYISTLVAQEAFGRPPSFELNPPGGVSLSHLACENGKVVVTPT